mmetsp:Transcript_25400/g.35444  ORF Transcript_25400/g.35444 Transcript_25400/m.35444 type:complete len:165 (-) Transcript_25400:164-658(-)
MSFAFACENMCVSLCVLTTNVLSCVRVLLLLLGNPRHPSARKEKKSKKRKSTSTRTRISIACMNCRGSKVKCTGGKPCARCKKMKIECVIPEQRSKRRAGGGAPSRRHFLEPIIDEHGKRRKALADKFNRNNGQKCYRNEWCTRPNKHPGHCKDHRASSANNHR